MSYAQKCISLLQTFSFTAHTEASEVVIIGDRGVGVSCFPLPADSMCSKSHCPKKVMKPEEVRSRRPEPNTEGKAYQEGENKGGHDEGRAQPAYGGLIGEGVLTWVAW